LPLITPEYAALNAELHQRRPDYGTSGHKWAPAVIDLLHSTGSRTVLDYGAGKGTLGQALMGVDVREYDPAIRGKDAPPKPAHVVVCGDVMEHVEPECTDDVLAHACNLAERAVLFVISTREGGKLLADGRPAHINVQPPEWWWEKLRGLGDFRPLPSVDGEIAAVWIKCRG
jgi:hypothetical protein